MPAERTLVRRVAGGAVRHFGLRLESIAMDRVVDFVRRTLARVRGELITHDLLQHGAADRAGVLTAALASVLIAKKTQPAMEGERKKNFSTCSLNR
jgi:hypothetical protein